MLQVRSGAILASIVVLSGALAACGSGSMSSVPKGPALASTSGPGTSGDESPRYHAEVALDGHPWVTADGANILVTVKVTNDGNAPFGTQATPIHNVNLGAHVVDASGKILNWNLARGSMPEVAPGAAVKATILLPVDKVLGHSAELLPVEENVAWFDKWGTKPLTVGPFLACANPSIGKVCDSSGKPLPTVAAQ